MAALRPLASSSLLLVLTAALVELTAAALGVASTGVDGAEAATAPSRAAKNIALHLGHLPRWPATWSGTRN